MVNPDVEPETEEKPDPWLMSSQSDASFQRGEKQESRVSVKRKEIPVISETVEMAATVDVETVPIVTGDMSKKMKMEEVPERKEEEKKKKGVKVEQKKEETEEKEPKGESVSKETASMDLETEKSILKLRKLSMDYIEKERKKSMELEAITATTITPDANDDFEFSDDDDNEPFDVPDISLWFVFYIHHFRGNQAMTFRTEILILSRLSFL